MTHEFHLIVDAYRNAKSRGQKSVLATVVALEGSSYRRPGVRMLICSDGSMTGAVSGGCVEKEVLKQSGSVFNTRKAKMVTYDGRYRKGCEGILYILLEFFDPAPEFISCYEKALQNRDSFEIKSSFSRLADEGGKWGSVILFEEIEIPFFSNESKQSQLSLSAEVFCQKLDACFSLMIIGGEHDAVQLSQFASLMGWEVMVVTGLSDPHSLGDFPGAKQLIHELPESLDTSRINGECAVIVMTHNYVQDLKYLLALQNCQPAYIGLLGPAKRRERMLHDILEQNPLAEGDFLESIHGPVGLNIGAETPQEVSLSILSEILAVIRQENPIPLMNKIGAIH